MLREPTPIPVTNRPELTELRRVETMDQGKKKLTCVNRARFEGGRLNNYTDTEYDDSCHGGCDENKE